MSCDLKEGKDGNKSGIGYTFALEFVKTEYMCFKLLVYAVCYVVRVCLGFAL